MNVESRTPAADAARRRRCRELLEQVCHRAHQRLQKCLGAMLDQVDDALFAFAEKSASSAVQTAYFDAMREVRRRRGDVIAAFHRALREALQRATGERDARRADAAPPLGLVQDETMEEDIAVGNMVQKIATACRTELHILERRFGALMDGPAPRGAEQPLGPEVICQALRQALALTRCDIRARLVILKLFDRTLTDALQEVYHECNQSLGSAGVLPGIRPEIRRDAAAGAGSTPPARPGAGDGAGEGAGPPGGGSLLGSLQRLLNDGVSRIAQAAQPPAGPTDEARSAARPRAQAVAELSRLQQAGVAAEADGPGPAGLNVVRQLKRTHLGQMDKAGDLIIDIVATLFDYLLEDRRLPDALRVQLGRLQIPVVKLALLDPEFFSRKSHPARRLLSLVAEAGIEWADDAARSKAFCKALESAVQRVLKEFDRDAGLFVEVVESLEIEVADLRRDGAGGTAEAAAAKETPDGDTARDAAADRSRLSAAESLVRGLLLVRLRRDGIPRPVGDFLLMHWKRHLVALCAREGEHSAAFEAGVRTLDDLLWSVQPKPAADDRRRLIGLLAGLLRRVHAGMEAVALPAATRREFLATLARCHTELMRTGQTVGVPLVDTTAAGRGRTAGPADRAVDTPARQTAAPRPAVAQVPPSAEATRSGPVTGQAAGQSVAHQRLVERLQRGTWLEFLGAGGRPIPARLSWQQPGTGDLLFTDREGRKLVKRSQAALAEDFRAGRVRLAQRRQAAATPA